MVSFTNLLLECPHNISLQSDMSTKLLNTFWILYIDEKRCEHVNIIWEWGALSHCGSVLAVQILYHHVSLVLQHHWDENPAASGLGTPIQQGVNCELSFFSFFLCYCFCLFVSLCRGLMSTPHIESKSCFEDKAGSWQILFWRQTNRQD